MTKAVTQCDRCDGWGGVETPHGWLDCEKCERSGFFIDGRHPTLEEYKRICAGERP